MTKLASQFPEFVFLLHQQTGPDEHAVLLRKDNGYAACTMRPKRRVATTPNFTAGGYGLITGPLTSDGLTDLLQWCDKGTATNRYRELSGLPDNVATLLPDGGPPG